MDHTSLLIFFFFFFFFFFAGTGEIDGQGYYWWWFVIITTIDNRPHMIMMEETTNIVFQGGLRFKNSPQYHLFLLDVVDVYITDIGILLHFSLCFSSFFLFFLSLSLSVPSRSLHYFRIRFDLAKTYL